VGCKILHGWPRTPPRSSKQMRQREGGCCCYSAESGERGDWSGISSLVGLQEKEKNKRKKVRVYG
jgi:hypothetical protein